MFLKQLNVCLHHYDCLKKLCIQEEVSGPGFKSSAMFYKAASHEGQISVSIEYPVQKYCQH